VGIFLWLVTRRAERSCGVSQDSATLPEARLFIPPLNFPRTCDQGIWIRQVLS